MTAFWSSNLASKVSHLLYLVLLFFIPVQLGKHFWPTFSFIDGIRIDFLSVIIYLSDIIFLLFFLVSFPLLFSLSKKIWIGIVLVFGYLSLVSLFSFLPLNSLYGVLRLTEYCYVAYATAQYLKDKSMQKNIVLLFSCSTFLISLITIMQFFFQHSLGGMFYFLGERTFSASTPGIANASLNGSLVLRPYATFPHPNVLAGFLGVTLTLLLFGKSFFARQRYVAGFITLALLMGVSALLLTLSRTALFAFLVVIILWSSTQKKWVISRLSVLSFLLILLLMVSGVIYRFSSLSFHDEALLLRVEQLQQAWQSFLTSPVFGVGYRNYLPSLSGRELTTVAVRFLQPAHNVFVLLFVEIGVFGVSGLVVLLWKGYKKKRRQIDMVSLSLLAFIVITGMTDHYWYTLHQGQLLAAFVLGFISTRFVSRA